MEITPLTLRAMLADAAEIGATNALIKVGELKPWISKAEAYRRYGMRTVNKWIEAGLIKLSKPTPNSVKRHINVQEIEAVNKAYNKPIYNNGN